MNKMENAMQLKPVNRSDYLFLYDLLKERDPRVNISHKRIPTYAKHVQFVMSKPYSKWYIIQYKRQKVGSIYLTKQNEIGIFIKKGHQGNNYGKIAMQLLIKKNPRSRYLANVNPKNTKSTKFFKQNGFKLIQHTYELDLSN